MTQKIYALMLTAPLLFSACNSTAVSPKTANVQNGVQAQEKTMATQKASTVETTVTYVNNKDEIKSLGNAHIESFMVTLKEPLMQLINMDSSYKSAMGGCSSIAMSRTNEYNAVSNVKVRRTALKYRNPANKPDETDKIVMEHFLASNNLKDSLVVDMGNNYRVYKALDMKKPCLACHGENISEDLQKMLTRTYPKDMATGFKLGEFRGVVVAKVKK